MTHHGTQGGAGTPSWPKPADISVVICAYTEERWADLCAAVESVQRQTIPPREVIVVIDHNAKLLERARSAIPNINLIENREARGLSGARNSGLAAAQGAVIAFMDEDAVAAPDWLEWLMAGYAQPEVLGVGGAIEPMWLNQRPAWFPAEFNWVVGCTYLGMPKATAPVRNLIGCNMSLRREVFDAVGGFRTGIGRIGTLPVGCEETELCIRASQHWPQGIMLYEPRAKVDHRVPASRGQWKYFRSRCYAEGISKALIGQFVGSRDGLASERSYTLRTLPEGVVRGFGSALLGKDRMGAARALAILAGLIITVAGYSKGIISARLKRSTQASLPSTPHTPSY